MLPYDIRITARQHKRKQCDNVQPIVKFSKPLRMAAAPSMRTPKVNTQTPAPLAKPLAHTVAVLMIPGKNDAGEDVVGVELSVHPPLKGRAGCYVKLTEREKEFGCRHV